MHIFCDYKHSEINVKQKYIETRRVLSETKAIMSPPYAIGWKQLLLTGRWYYKLELLQEVMKFHKLFPNSSNGSRNTRNFVTITLNYHLDIEVTLVKHALCTSTMVFYICAKSFQNVTNSLRVIDGPNSFRDTKHNYVLYFIKLNYFAKVDLEINLVIHYYLKT